MHTELASVGVTDKVAALIADTYRPPVVVGMMSSRWLPPPSADERLADRAVIALYAALRPATEAEVRAALRHLALISRPMVGELDEIKARVNAMVSVITAAGWPRDILRNACNQHAHTSPWWVSYHDLAKLAQPQVEARQRQLVRAKILIRVARNPAPDGQVTADWAREVFLRGA